MAIDFKVEVIADDSGQWAGNALVFDSEEKAWAYARDLAGRWLLVRDWRVVRSDGTVLERGRAAS